MQRIGYYLSLPFIYLISILPFPVLYFISDAVYVLIYRLMGYRKKIVRENLQRSFPDHSQQDLLVIEKKFYHHFCDLFIETAKCLTLPQTALIKRSRFTPGSMEVFNRLHEQGKHCMALMGHSGNWEMAGLSMSAQAAYLLKVIYRPLRNKFFDRFTYRLRSRFGALPVAMNDVARDLMKNRSPLACTVFIADQTPFPEDAIWLNFLKQDTPFFRGADTLSRRLNYPVVFATVRKLKRGYYDIHIELLCEESGAMNEGEITSLFVKKLEEEIRMQPENWLWSHRRWKYKRK